MLLILPFDFLLDYFLKRTLCDTMLDWFKKGSFLSFHFTNTAIKHPHGCPSSESRNPGKDWMPDQVRHDVVGALCCQ
jgi:hypothetical protein